MQPDSQDSTLGLLQQPRSSPGAIDHLASVLFNETRVRDIVIVVMPKENTAIHLDMIFTQVDRGSASASRRTSSAPSG